MTTKNWFFKARSCREVKVIEALIIDMKSVYKITLLFGITILVSSCHNNAANISIFQICMSTLDMKHILIERI
jgi:hypothetical protein